MYREYSIQPHNIERLILTGHRLAACAVVGCLSKNAELCDPWLDELEVTE